MITNADIGKRIRALREKRGMTQMKLGQALGYTSHVPIVNMESGRHNISVVELYKLAQVLRVSLRSLVPGLLSGRQSNALSIALRASPILTREEQSEILEYYELKRQQKQEANESFLGGLSLRTSEGARALARYHLRELGVTKPPVDLKYARFHWNIDYDEKDLGEKVSGLLIRDGLLQLICVNSIHAPSRKRMTVAHEMGHFHLDTVVFHCNIGVEKEDDSQEELAFQYAHELLMPSDWLRANKERWQRNPIEVAHECQVSPIACEVWARAIGLPLPMEFELMRRHEDILKNWESKRARARAR